MTVHVKKILVLILVLALQGQICLFGDLWQIDILVHFKGYHGKGVIKTERMLIFY